MRLKFKIFKKKFIKTLIRFPISQNIRAMLLRFSGYKIGNNTLIGPNFVVSDRGVDWDNIVIGDRVNIASGVTLVTTSSPGTSCLSKIFQVKYGQIKIEDDVWIGTGAVVFPGVTIGKGSVIGAGVIVQGNIPPYHILRRAADVLEPIKNDKLQILLAEHDTKI